MFDSKQYKQAAQYTKIRPLYRAKSPDFDRAIHCIGVKINIELNKLLVKLDLSSNDISTVKEILNIIALLEKRAPRKRAKPEDTKDII